MTSNRKSLIGDPLISSRFGNPSIKIADKTLDGLHCYLNIARPRTFSLEPYLSLSCWSKEMAILTRSNIGPVLIQFLMKTIFFKSMHFWHPSDQFTGDVKMPVEWEEHKILNNFIRNSLTLNLGHMCFRWFKKVCKFDQFATNQPSTEHSLFSATLTKKNLVS